MLRDVIRQFSNGCGQEAGRRVGVVDERSEIAACYRGIPQNDMGIRTECAGWLRQTYGSANDAEVQ